MHHGSIRVRARDLPPDDVLALGHPVPVPEVRLDDRAPGRVGAAVVPLFSTTLFLSAFLLFVVEPMIAKMALPILGGAPMVWNTCVVFFQATLLAGYAYACGAARWLDVRRHTLAHTALLLASLAALPVVLPAGAIAPAQASPVPWLLGVLAAAIGIPFLALSTTASVLQHWLSRTRHPSGRDPYFLYASSNLGSLLALAAYPTFIEPALSLRMQARLWATGYAGLVALVGACSLLVWRWTDARQERPSAPADATERASRTEHGWRPLRWTALAFVPSSLMLAITTFISTDIAAVPLLWVVPLGLYLLTFVLAFGRRREPARSLARVAVPLLFVLLVMLLIANVRGPLSLVLPLHLAAFAAAALWCHAELAHTRPEAAHLTGFYFWISLGGMLGGLFNTLAAPLLFSRVAEYPLVIVLGCLLLATPAGWRDGRRILDLAVPLAAGVVTGALLWWVRARGVSPGLVFAALGVPALAAFRERRRPVRFAMTLAAMLVAGGLVGPGGERLLHAERTFFGVYRVFVDGSGRYHGLAHGTTLHGIESLEPARRHEPLTYFHRTGPFGQALEALPQARRSHELAVVGLGAGTLATYARDGQRWTFFEIDPAIERIARTPAYFTFLPDCGSRCRVVIGDARLSLARAEGPRYGVIVPDAFSSDAIPIHLMTDEAVSLYLRRLEEGGALLFHISNAHLDLGPILARLAARHHLIAREQTDRRRAGWPEGKSESRWIVMARRRSDLGSLAADPRWHPPAAGTSTPLWTDDFSNILSLLSFR